MVDSALPAEVLRFIQDHIHSVEQLEVLLLLRQHPDRSWSPDEVSRELRTERLSASQRLEDLHRRKLLQVVTPGSYRFGPASADLAQAVERLADSYSTRRVSVIEAIFAAPSASLRTFAEAFRIKKGDE